MSNEPGRQDASSHDRDGLRATTSHGDGPPAGTTLPAHVWDGLHGRARLNVRQGLLSGMFNSAQLVPLDVAERRADGLLVIWRLRAGEPTRLHAIAVRDPALTGPGPVDLAIARLPRTEGRERPVRTATSAAHSKAVIRVAVWSVAAWIVGSVALSRLALAATHDSSAGGSVFAALLLGTPLLGAAYLWNRRRRGRRSWRSVTVSPDPDLQASVRRLVETHGLATALAEPAAAVELDLALGATRQLLWEVAGTVPYTSSDSAQPLDRAATASAGDSLAVLFTEADELHLEICESYARRPPPPEDVRERPVLPSLASTRGRRVRAQRQTERATAAGELTRDAVMELRSARAGRTGPGPQDPE